jgi:hypothetical protein
VLSHLPLYHLPHYKLPQHDIYTHHKLIPSATIPRLKKSSERKISPCIVPTNRRNNLKAGLQTHAYMSPAASINLPEPFHHSSKTYSLHYIHQTQKFTKSTSAGNILPHISPTTAAILVKPMLQTPSNKPQLTSIKVMRLYPHFSQVIPTSRPSKLKNNANCPQWETLHPISHQPPAQSCQNKRSRNRRMGTL